MKMQNDPAVLTSAELLDRLDNSYADDEKLVGRDIVLMGLEVVAALALSAAANWATTWF